MIAVSAATGKTGSVLSNLLDVAGREHKRLSRRSDGDRYFDWTDRSSWASAFEGVTSVHLVKPPHGTPMAELVHDLLSTTPSLERVVLLSEMAREQHPETDPDRSVELVVEAWGGSWTILRPSWFFQNFSAEGDYIADVLRGELSFPTGDAPISWVDVRDVAEVSLLALTGSMDSGLVHTLTGPESFGVNEVAERIAGVLGRSVCARDPLDLDGLNAMRDGSDRMDYYVGLLIDVLEGRFAAVTETIAELLGKPPRRFQDFIRERRGDWK